MAYTVSITSQGQISIPIQLRRKLGLDKNKKALVSEEGNRIIVQPVKDIFKLGGSLQKYAKGKKILSNEQLHDLVAQEVADDYLEKLKRN